MSAFTVRRLEALVGLNEGLQDLRDLALEGKTIGRDDLRRQALQWYVPEKIEQKSEFQKHTTTRRSYR